MLLNESLMSTLVFSGGNLYRSSRRGSSERAAQEGIARKERAVDESYGRTESSVIDFGNEVWGTILGF